VSALAQFVLGGTATAPSHKDIEAIAMVIISNRVLHVSAIAIGLWLASCHNSERSNPLDPEATPGVSIGVAEDGDGTATISWTPYDGTAPFGKYLILRRISSLSADVDTVAVEEDHLVIHVSLPDTVATISDATQTSFVDRSLVANQSFIYRVSVINAGGFEISSPESAPVAGATAPRRHGATTGVLHDARRQ